MGDEKRKFANLTNALRILDDAKTMNKPHEVLLRGDGVFITSNNNLISNDQILRKYHDLAVAVERAHTLINNSI